MAGSALENCTSYMASDLSNLLNRGAWRILKWKNCAPRAAMARSISPHSSSRRMRYGFDALATRAAHTCARVTAGIAHWPTLMMCHCLLQPWRLSISPRMRPLHFFAAMTRIFAAQEWLEARLQLWRSRMSRACAHGILCSHDATFAAQEWLKQSCSYRHQACLAYVHTVIFCSHGGRIHCAGAAGGKAMPASCNGKKPRRTCARSSINAPQHEECSSACRVGRARA